MAGEDVGELKKAIVPTVTALLGLVVGVWAASSQYSTLEHIASTAHQRASDNASDIDTEIRPRLRELEREMTAYKTMQEQILSAIKDAENRSMERDAERAAMAQVRHNELREWQKRLSDRLNVVEDRVK